MPQKFPNSSLYAITDTTIAGCDHGKIVDEWLRAGVRLIQIREKEASARDFCYAAEVVMRLAEPVQATVIINDRVDIAQIVGAHGVHLGQDDISPEKARSLLGENAIIGFSTHSLAQAQIAEGLPIDYIAVGPVFRTATKASASAGVTGGQVGLDLVRDVKAHITKPLVAIGGITLALAPDVLSAGADAVAVISDLLNYGTIETRAREFLMQLNKTK